ncbi:MAG: DUF4301 family protein [Paludibacteraceae bacterium]|nr:DUF4301 family protein [Paludibacteraceae bacterium]
MKTKDEIRLTEDDIALLQSRGISTEAVEKQYKILTKGAPVPKVLRTAAIEDGITVLNVAEQDLYVNAWDRYLDKGKSISHFIPASGTAHRFFRELFNFLNADYDEPQTNYEKNFFKHLPSFAFFAELDQTCVEKTGKTIEELLEENRYKQVLSLMLTDEGLNYRSLPTALFKYHTDKSKRFVALQKYLHKKIIHYYLSFENTRTPIQEHLIEAAMVSGRKDGVVNVCFTVAEEHREAVQNYTEEFRYPIEKKFGLNFILAFPMQSHATDSLILTDQNEWLRNEDGTFCFHCGGHGTVFPSFCDLKAEVAFINNIDNVSIDQDKPLVAKSRKMLGGLLVNTQKSINKYIKLIDKEDVSEDKLIEIINFVENVLNVKHDKILSMSRKEQYAYLRSKLNRPLRVCGMVRNEEEQGGMPCWVRNTDGTSSLQIIEYYQVAENANLKHLFEQSTHFNPVDMVCFLRDYKGKPYNLKAFANEDEAIVCHKKAVEGNDLVMMEYPGLWNGCMADWNTIFVDIPVKTFTPVKNINDLLRHEHQNF